MCGSAACILASFGKTPKRTAALCVLFCTVRPTALRTRYLDTGRSERLGTSDGASGGILGAIHGAPDVDIVRDIRDFVPGWAARSPATACQSLTVVHLVSVNARTRGQAKQLLVQPQQKLNPRCNQHSKMPV